MCDLECRPTQKYNDSVLQIALSLRQEAMLMGRHSTARLIKVLKKMGEKRTKEPDIGDSPLQCKSVIKKQVAVYFRNLRVFLTMLHPLGSLLCSNNQRTKHTQAMCILTYTVEPPNTRQDKKGCSV